MKNFLLVFLLLTKICWGSAGEITKIVGDGAYVIRDQKKIMLSSGFPLEQSDELHSEGSTVVLYLYPGTQLSLARKSHIRITENKITVSGKLERTNSLIEFSKGIIRGQIIRGKNQEIEQRFQTELVTFSVRGTEFEISFSEDEDVDLDVVNGVVEASSPFVQSFVPEYIKTNEAIRFNRAKKIFERRKFDLKIKNDPVFLSKKIITDKWQKLKLKKSVKNK